MLQIWDPGHILIQSSRNLESLSLDIFKLNVYSFMHKYHFKKLTNSFAGMFQLQRETDQLQTRDNHENYVVSVPLAKTYCHFPKPTFIPIWYGLSDTIKATVSHKVFIKQFKESLIESYPNTVDCEQEGCEYCVRE